MVFMLEFTGRWQTNSMKGEARRSCGWTSCGPLAAVHFSGTCIEIERPWDAPWYLGIKRLRNKQGVPDIGVKYVLELTTNLGCLLLHRFHMVSSWAGWKPTGRNKKKHPK